MTVEHAERSGVRILIASQDTKIPDWIISGQGVEVKIEDLQGKVFPLVELSRGDASFFGGGGVELRIGRQKGFRVGFEPDEVLEIQSLDGKLIKRNHHMCVECMANTGKMISYQPAEFAGLVDAVFQCAQNPLHQWTLQNI